MSSISIYWNDSLSECEVASVCDYLSIPGVYTYIYDNAEGCDSVHQVIDACATVKADNFLFEKNISLSPNPNSGVFYLTGDIKEGSKLDILDFCGRKQLIFTLNAGSTSIDVSRLTPGLYLAMITDTNGILTKKFIKQ
jgi:hypothetical protein